MTAGEEEYIATKVTVISMGLHRALIVALVDIHRQNDLIRDIANKASRSRVVFARIITMIVNKLEPVFNHGEDSIAFAMCQQCFFQICITT